MDIVTYRAELLVNTHYTTSDKNSTWFGNVFGKNDIPARTIIVFSFLSFFLIQLIQQATMSSNLVSGTLKWFYWWMHVWKNTFVCVCVCVYIYKMKKKENYLVLILIIITKST